jgi:hypothetical protein
VQEVVSSNLTSPTIFPDFVKPHLVVRLFYV